MSDNCFVPVGRALLIAIIMCLLGTAVGRLLTEHYFQDEAVKRGHAEWVVGVDGSTTFQWKEGR